MFSLSSIGCSSSYQEAVINAEMTLTNRDSMLFRMLIGRTSLNDRFLIDPSASYCQGKPSSSSTL